MGSVEPVRHTGLGEGYARRTLDERLFVRLPRFVRLAGTRFMRMKPESRLRGALLRRRIRQVYGAFNRGDMESFLALGNDPEVELHTAQESGAGVGLRNVYRGHTGLVEFRQDWFEAWEGLRVELLDVIDCADRIAVLLRMQARGRGSGVDVEQPSGQLLTLGPTGLAVRIDNFWDHDRALEAAGLPRDSSHQP